MIYIQVLDLRDSSGNFEDFFVFLVGVGVSVTLLTGSSLTCLFFCFARFTFSVLLNLLENYLQLVYYPGVS